MIKSIRNFFIMFRISKYIISHLSIFIGVLKLYASGVKFENQYNLHIHVIKIISNVSGSSKILYILDDDRKTFLAFLWIKKSFGKLYGAANNGIFFNVITQCRSHYCFWRGVSFIFISYIIFSYTYKYYFFTCRERNVSWHMRLTTEQINATSERSLLTYALTRKLIIIHSENVSIWIALP